MDSGKTKDRAGLHRNIQKKHRFQYNFAKPCEYSDTQIKMGDASFTSSDLFKR